MLDIKDVRINKKSRIYGTSDLSALLKLESAPASAPASAPESIRSREHPLPNLIGSDRSHDKWERMRERILGSGCGSGFSGVDFKSCDLSESIRLGSGCSQKRMLSGVDAGADALGSGCSRGADAGADTTLANLIGSDRSHDLKSAPENPLPHPLPRITNFRQQ